ncbi:DUF1116 domain-containing protein [Neomoorella thermoacetica]|uniref:DUF1116 domain-containing protein n=1 Tax=Neomoorella thermoacetica TaxID=1525 RepID=UPI0030CA9649
MTLSRDLINGPVKVINVGLESFAHDLTSLGVANIHVEWRPPANGDPHLVRLLALIEENIDVINAANQKAVNRLLEAQPKLVDVKLAGEVIPGFERNMILHSGPPITWSKMCGPMRGAVIGALIYEGLADNAEQAEKLAASGEIKFAPCHEYSAVGPMSGIISASMPVFVVENETAGNRAYSNFNEGLGKVLRFGANSPEIIERLRWIRDVLAPALRNAILACGGVDLKTLTAKALQMGDECHNRNLAATSLLTRTLMPALVKTCPPNKLEEVASFLAKNDHFYLNISMAACKAILDAAHGIPGSTLVTAMARNGVEFGIRVSGLGNEWFTAPAPYVKGLYFPGYNDEDANPDLGDSAITETCGLGGFAMAAAPAIVQFVGGTPQDALNYTLEMYNITLTSNPAYTIPNLGFRPTPTGIDVLKVVETGINPIINTGIAHREAGVGQIGAGLVRAPMECFVAALHRLAETIS